MGKGRCRLPTHRALMAAGQFRRRQSLFRVKRSAFWQAHEMLRRLTGTGLCMPRDYYAQQIAQGRISRSDLTDALQQLEIPWDIDELEYALSQRPEPSEKL